MTGGGNRHGSGNLNLQAVAETLSTDWVLGFSGARTLGVFDGGKNELLRVLPCTLRNEAEWKFHPPLRRCNKLSGNLQQRICSSLGI